MMGRRNEEQGQFVYLFDLDKVVPPSHLVRQIDSLLDLSTATRCLSRLGAQYPMPAEQQLPQWECLERIAKNPQHRQLDTQSSFATDSEVERT